MQEEDKMVVAGKKVLVFGSGISGIGAVKLLEENGADVVLYDGNEKLTPDTLSCVFGVPLLQGASQLRRLMQTLNHKP